MFDPQLFGEALVRLRGTRPQREVAKQARVAVGTWCAWERGQRFPRGVQMPKILAGLDCSEEQIRAAMWEIEAERLLFKGSTAEPETLEARGRQHGPVLKVLREQFDRMPEPVSKTVARLLVSIRETGQALNKVQADLEAVIVVLGQKGGHC